MRKHAAYTLYKRVLPSGDVVFYYQSYDQDGRRLPGRSTGQSTKSAAKAYCDMLLKEGLLWDGEQVCKIPLFKDYAKGWWETATPAISPSMLIPPMKLPRCRRDLRICARQAGTGGRYQPELYQAGEFASAQSYLALLQKYAA
jgi:hypothetical protein